VDVFSDLLGGQLPEFLPCPALGVVDLAYYREVSLLKRRVRCRAGGEDREAIDQVLARRETVVRLSAAAPEAPRYKPFAHVPYLLALSLAIWPL